MYPLLIQGIFSNPQGTQRTLTPGASTSARWQNNIKVGRGNLIGLEPVTTNISLSNSSVDNGTFSYYVGSQIVFDSLPNSNYVAAAKPGVMWPLNLVQPGGQSVSLNFQNGANASGLMMHHYFENKFNTPAIIAARQTNTLKTRIKAYHWDFSNGVKLNSGAQFSVPVGLGNVVAVEVFTEINTGGFRPLSLCLFTISVGGTSIIEDANAGEFTSEATKAPQIFPILIRPGETFTATADTSDNLTLSTMKLTLKLYFDDDLTGKKIY